MRGSAFLAIGILAVTLLMVVPGLPGLVAAPSMVHPTPATTASPVATPASAPVAPVTHPTPPSPSGAAKSAVTCPTPLNAPVWNSANFFQDALVTFQVPGDPALSGTNFYTVPCLNVIPTYQIGFWMNVSTNVPLAEAYVTIWATSYPTPGNPLPPLNGFDPSSPALRSMDIPAGAPNTATFFFNVYRDFYPGTTVYFNITLQSTKASPSSISSTESSYRQEVPANAPDNATWQFYVAAPWWSTTFANDIRVSTDPSILGSVAYPPNPAQTFTVNLSSVGANGQPGPGIPAARFTFVLSGAFTGTFSLPFGPLNSTNENLSSPGPTNGIGPYPHTEVTFFITAWLPWEGGIIDEITSQNYTFNWSSQGGWASPSLGLEENAQLNASYGILNHTGVRLPTGVPVNVTVHVAVPNETISSALLKFTYSDAGGTVTGSLPMTLLTYNTSYVVIPGLPSGGTLTFSLIAKDVFSNPLSSGNYSYVETGDPTLATGTGNNWIFVEGTNLSDGALAVGAPFTIDNATWHGSGITNSLGFGAFESASAAGYLLLGDGVYVVTMTLGGHVLTTEATLSGAVPLVVRFGFSGDAPVNVVASVPNYGLVVGLVAGPIAVTAALFPLLLWYRERRAKALAEQKRITL